MEIRKTLKRIIFIFINFYSLLNKLLQRLSFAMALLFLSTLFLGNFCLFGAPLKIEETNNNFNDKSNKLTSQKSGFTTQLNQTINSEKFQGTKDFKKENATWLQNQKAHLEDNSQFKKTDSFRQGSEKFKTGKFQESKTSNFLNQQNQTFENSDFKQKKLFPEDVSSKKMNRLNDFFKERFDKPQEMSMRDLNKYHFGNSYSDEDGLSISQAAGNSYEKDSQGFWDSLTGSSAEKRKTLKIKKPFDIGTVNTNNQPDNNASKNASYPRASANTGPYNTTKNAKKDPAIVQEITTQAQPSSNTNALPTFGVPQDMRASPLEIKVQVKQK